MNTLRVVASVALLLTGCRPVAAPPVARYEFHTHPAAGSIGIWRCDRFTGEIWLAAIGPDGQTKWIELTNAPPVE